MRAGGRRRRSGEGEWRGPGWEGSSEGKFMGRSNWAVGGRRGGSPCSRRAAAQWRPQRLGMPRLRPVGVIYSPRKGRMSISGSGWASSSRGRAPAAALAF